MRPEDIVAAARDWIGTPYAHGQSVKGAGTDCLGLARGVWRDLFGAEPETPPPYAPGWAETGDGEALLAAAARHLHPLPIPAARSGDVLIYRILDKGPAKHCAILSEGTAEAGRMIHAYQGAGRVLEGPVFPVRRLAGAFRFDARETG